MTPELKHVLEWNFLSQAVVKKHLIAMDSELDEAACFYWLIRFLQWCNESV